MHSTTTRGRGSSDEARNNAPRDGRTITMMPGCQQTPRAGGRRGVVGWSSVSCVQRQPQSHPPLPLPCPPCLTGHGVSGEDKHRQHGCPQRTVGLKHAENGVVVEELKDGARLNSRPDGGRA